MFIHPRISSCSLYFNLNGNFYVAVLGVFLVLQKNNALMKLLPIFLTVVFASSLLMNLRQQAEQARSGLTQHANSLRMFACEKMPSLSGIKRIFENMKKKILSKTKGEKKKHEEEDDDINVNSSALNEFLKKFAEELSKHQQKNQEKSSIPKGTENVDNHEETHEHSEEDEEIDEKGEL